MQHEQVRVQKGEDVVRIAEARCVDERIGMMARDEASIWWRRRMWRSGELDMEVERLGHSAG